MSQKYSTQKSSLFYFTFFQKYKIEISHSLLKITYTIKLQKSPICGPTNRTFKNEKIGTEELLEGGDGIGNFSEISLKNKGILVIELSK